MIIKNKFKKDTIVEILKWCSVILLLFLIVIINCTYYSYNCYIKNIIVCMILVFIMFIVLTTKFWKMLVILGKEAYLELQKVVWPTYQETLNTTLVISAVTIVISLILWGLDTVLVHLISFGLRF